MPGRKEKIRFLRRIPKDPITGRAEWDYFLSSLIRPGSMPSAEIAVLPADLNDFPGLIRTMEADTLRLAVY